MRRFLRCFKYVRVLEHDLQTTLNSREALKRELAEHDKIRKTLVRKISEILETLDAQKRAMAEKERLVENAEKMIDVLTEERDVLGDVVTAQRLINNKKIGGSPK